MSVSTVAPAFTEDMVWQGGGGRNAAGTKFSIDCWCHHVFGQFTRESVEAYRFCQMAIVDTDPRMMGCLPGSIDVESWNDDMLCTSPGMIVRAWNRALELMA